MECKSLKFCPFCPFYLALEIIFHKLISNMIADGFYMKIRAITHFTWEIRPTIGESIIELTSRLH